MQPHDSFDDYGGLTEVPPVQETQAQSESQPDSHGQGVTTTGAYPSVQNRAAVSGTGAYPAVHGSPANVSGRHATFQGAVTPRPDEPRARSTQATGAHAAVHGAPLIAAATVATPVPPSPAATSGRVATISKEDDDDGNAREPVVPRGTFASEVPERSAEGDEREVVRVTPEPAPQQQRDASQGRPVVARAPGASTSQRIKSVRPAARPPYLASEILREDLTPTEPGRRNIIVALHVAPALGAVAVLSSGIDHVATWASLLALATLFTLTRFELSYHFLAVLVASIGGVSLALASGFRVAMGGGFDGPLLAAATTLLPAALLFRTWYRAAYTARVLVTLALVLCVMWATRTSNSGLLALGFDWQSWVPALTWYLFAILCLLALLAFMSDETTGGCDAWALGVSIWYGMFACLRFALETHGGTTIANFQTLGLLEPALAAVTAVALAQLFSGIFGNQRRPA